MIELKEAKMLFDAGVLVTAFIKKDELFGGYVILFDQMKGKEAFRVVYRNQRTKDAKVFKHLDSAVNAVKMIGFRNATLCDL